MYMYVHMKGFPTKLNPILGEITPVPALAYIVQVRAYIYVSKYMYMNNELPELAIHIMHTCTCVHVNVHGLSCSSTMLAKETYTIVETEGMLYCISCSIVSVVQGIQFVVYEIATASGSVMRPDGLCLLKGPFFVIHVDQPETVSVARTIKG